MKEDPKKPSRVAAKLAAKTAQFAGKENTALADRPTLFGEPTEPFGARRLMAAQAMGFRFFRLSDAEREQLNDQNFIYDGMFWDATIAAYICQCPLSEVFHAIRTPTAIMEKAGLWAENLKIAPGRSSFEEVMGFLAYIIEGIVASSAQEVNEKTESPKPKARAAEGLPGE